MPMVLIQEECNVAVSAFVEDNVPPGLANCGAVHPGASRVMKNGLISCLLMTLTFRLERR